VFERRFVTLNFEGSFVRALTVRGDTIEWWTSLEFPADVMSHGVIYEPQAVGTELTTLFEKHQLPRKRVITCVTGQRSLSRVLTLPDVRERYLEGAITRKAKQEIALPLEDTDLTWRILGRQDDQLEVFVLALPKAIIDAQVESLQAAGLRSRVIDAKPLALIRAVGEMQAIILNLEKHGAGVIITAEGIPALARTLPLEAEQPHDSTSLDLLVRELARTTKFYNQSHKENPIPDEAPVYLTGAAFAHAAAVMQVRSQVVHPVRMPDPPLKFPEGLSIPEYCVNLGLALRRR